jgi:5'-nucleotidase (lipoprotein e(P4) family)
MMLKEEQSSKEERRRTIERTHEIVLLIGDNLNDLASVFEKKSISERSEEVDRVKDKFGSKFIVLPNPMYGDWESAIYEYQRGLSDEEKGARRNMLLKSF